MSSLLKSFQGIGCWSGVDAVDTSGAIGKVLLIVGVIGVESPVVGTIKVEGIAGCLPLLRRYLIRPDSNSPSKDRCSYISNSVYSVGSSSCSVLKKETVIVVRLSFFTYTL